MKTLLRKQLLMVTAMVTGTLVYANYEYDFVNMIGDPIVLKINQSRADNKDMYQIIFPGQTIKQTYGGVNAYCLEKLAWAPYSEIYTYTKERIPHKGGLALVDQKTGRILEEKQRLFGDEVARFYAFSPVKIELESNAEFQKTLNQAKKLLGGIDTFACQTIEAVKSLKSPGGGGGGTTPPSGSTTPPGGGGGGGGNTDKDKVLKLMADIADILDVDYTKKTPADKAAAKTQLESLVTGANITLLETVAKIPKVDIAQIKGGLNNEQAQTKAMEILQKGANAVTAATKIDTDAFIMHTSVDTGGTQKKCDFGLATIGKASGELKGGTLCKSRTFVIYYQEDADGLPKLDPKTTGPLSGRPLIKAITVQGE